METHINQHVLLIDGLNTFFRSYSASPQTNTNGEHIGGLIGFMRSLGSLAKQFSPTRIILCFDGKGSNKKRKKLHKGYKEGRNFLENLNRNITYDDPKEAKHNLTYQLFRLSKYVDYFPLQTIAIEGYEADDTIAFLTSLLKKEEDCERVTIVSSDKDFLQLVDEECVKVWRPVERKLYGVLEVQEKFNGVYYKNISIVRSFMGDSSDNIKGIKGIGIKTLQKYVPDINKKEISLDELYKQVCKKASTKLKPKLLTQKKELDLNFKLCTLQDDMYISSHYRNKIYDVLYNRKIGQLNKFKLAQMLTEDMAEDAIKNFDSWLSICWMKLNTLALKHNNSL